MKLFNELPFYLLLIASTIPLNAAAASTQETFSPKIAPDVFAKAKENSNWKHALVTGKSAQVVFMSVSPETNPKNEIGVETHKFDQVIFVASGQAKAIINGQTSTVKAGDMIFIPEGVQHNFINLNAKEPLKIISVYSATDIPRDATYQKQSDVPPE